MGLLRLILAVIVVFHHMTGFPFIGHFAVFFFFVLSGYLMTSVMHNSYGYTLVGWKKFWINRALRLYPAYLAIVAITLVVIAALGENFTSHFRMPIFVPQNFLDWAQNLSMVYLDAFPSRALPRLSPATWALTTELFFYFVISLGISRSKLTTYFWVAVSIIYTLFALITDLSYKWSYYFILAGSLPFSLGAVFYHHQDQIKKFVAHLRLKGFHLLMISCFLCAISFLIAYKGDIFLNASDSFPEKIALVIVNFASVLGLAGVLWNPWLPLGHAMDKLLGSLSYPVYISHWICGVIAGYLLGVDRPSWSADGIYLFMLGLSISLAVSLIIVWCIDEPIQKLRTFIRGKGTQS